MKRVLALCLCVCLLIAGLAGCKTSPEEFDLMDEKDAARYARRQFGKAEVLESETTEEYTNFTLRDEEYGFTYNLKHYIYRITIDAAVTNFYDDSVTTNFPKEYRAYILGELALDNIARDAMGYNRAGKDTIVWLDYESEAQAREMLPQVADRIRQVDSRGYFEDYAIAACAGERNLGSYYMGTDEFITAADEYAEQMLCRFSVEVNHNSGDQTGITYLYCEEVQFKDVERLRMEWLNDQEATPEDWTVAYYFDYKGKTYFMLDDIVFIRDAEGIEGNHMSAYYTSYWFS